MEIDNPKGGRIIKVTKDSVEMAVIQPEKARVDQMEVIDGLVRDYTLLHQEEVREIVAYARRVRGGLYHPTGSFKNRSGGRLALILPPGLKFLVERWYPNYFSEKKNVRAFMRKFPGFRIPERI